MRSFDWYRAPGSFTDDFYRAVALRLPLTRASRKEFFINLLLSLQSYDDILTDAELVSEGRFPALGLCIHEPDGTFDWHRDYGSGKTWPTVPHNRITFLDGDGADVKYVWELSRMYWIGWLGKAYWISNNGTWSREFMRLIDSWRESNPFNVGVNWSMPMEVGIRGFWLAVGFGLFHGAPNIPAEWWIDYLRLAWAHGRYLSSNLEYFSNLTNHYISNCFGLVAIGALLPGHPEGETWLREGRRRMIEELEHQVLSDGVHYERSISYHRLVLEMYLIATVLLDRAGLSFPADARGRIERMAEFMRDYTPPAGTIPQLGDSDDGVILRMQAGQELYDHRDLLALTAAIFRREDFRTAAGGYSQAALLLLGSEGFELFRAGGTGMPAGSRLYREGGFAILRGRNLHVVADVGPIGLHGNNDTLSFTLHDRAGEIIVDPGTYCYTRSAVIRNTLRATAAHDTPCVDEIEIAEFDGLWRVKEDRTNVEVLEWIESKDGGALAARHHAYSYLPEEVIIERRWALDEAGLVVHDRLTGAGAHSVSIRFTIHPSRTVRQVGPNEVMIGSEENGIHFQSSHVIETSAGWYSPSYGVASPATWLTVRHSGALPMEISYICRSIS